MNVLIIIVHLVNYNIEPIPLIDIFNTYGLFVTNWLNILILKGFICIELENGKCRDKI